MLNRTVAVTVLRSDLDPDNLTRFLREQRVMGHLSGHPHIVHVFQVGDVHVCPKVAQVGLPLAADLFALR